MLVRLACCVALAAAVLMPHGARAQNCAEEISKLMSKDTEKLTTRYQRVTKQIQEKGASPKLRPGGMPHRPRSSGRGWRTSSPP